MSTTQNKPLMPKATAVWLVDNTTLTFKQIADFCGMHELEVKGIADGEVAKGVMGINPIENGQLKKEELERCMADNNAKLQINISVVYEKASKGKKKTAKYTPVARRQDKPDAIYWLLKNFPDITDSTIGKLIGTTKNTIAAIRDRSHWNMQNIKPRDPVLLGICSQMDLDRTIERLKLEKREEIPEKPEMDDIFGKPKPGDLSKENVNNPDFEENIAWDTDSMGNK